MFQVMAVPGIEVKESQGFKLRKRRGPARIHPSPQQPRTFRHHPLPPRARQGFKVRPHLKFPAPKHLEGLQKIPPAARLGQHPIHPFAQPVSIRFHGTVPQRGGLVIDRAQGFQKLVPHFGSARKNGGKRAMKISFSSLAPASLIARNRAATPFSRSRSHPRPPAKVTSPAPPQPQQTQATTVFHTSFHDANGQSRIFRRRMTRLSWASSR